MKSTSTMLSYLKAINALNEKFGISLKYDPKTGKYILEDTENYDFEYINLIHDPVTTKPRFEL